MSALSTVSKHPDNVAGRSLIDFRRLPPNSGDSHVSLPPPQAQGETDGEAEWHNAALDFTHAMSYGDYLKLDKVLTPSSRFRPTTTKCCSSSSTRPRSYG